MAEIRFRPVGQSALGGQTASLIQGAQNSFARGADRITEILQNRQQQEQDNIGKLRSYNTGEIQNYLRSFRSPEELEAARASGEIQDTIARYGGVYDHNVVGNAFDTQLKAAREQAIAADQFDQTRNAQRARPNLTRLETSINTGLSNSSSLEGINNDAQTLRNQVTEELKAGLIQPSTANTALEQIEQRRLAQEKEFERVRTRNRLFDQQNRDDVNLAQQTFSTQIIDGVLTAPTLREALDLAETRITAYGQTKGNEPFDANERTTILQAVRNSWAAGKDLTPREQAELSTELAKEAAVLDNDQKKLEQRYAQFYKEDFLSTSRGDAVAQITSDIDDPEENIILIDQYIAAAQQQIERQDGNVLDGAPWGGLIAEAAKRTGTETPHWRFTDKGDLRDGPTFQKHLVEQYDRWIKKEKEEERIHSLRQGALDNKFSRQFLPKPQTSNATATPATPATDSNVRALDTAAATAATPNPAIPFDTSIPVNNLPQQAPEEPAINTFGPVGTDFPGRPAEERPLNIGVNTPIREILSRALGAFNNADLSIVDQPNNTSRGLLNRLSSDLPQHLTEINDERFKEHISKLSPVEKALLLRNPAAVRTLKERLDIGPQ